MKKGTRTWKLWAMVIVYCFSIIGVAGIYFSYFFNVKMDEIILFLATVTTMCLCCGYRWSYRCDCCRRYMGPCNRCACRPERSRSCPYWRRRRTVLWLASVRNHCRIGRWSTCSRGRNPRINRQIRERAVYAAAPAFWDITTDHTRRLAGAARAGFAIPIPHSMGER